MSPEKTTSDIRAVAYKSRGNTLLDKTRDKALYLGVRTLGPIIDQGQENILDHTPIEYEQGFWTEHTTLRLQGYVPIDAAAPHTAQHDANSLAKLTHGQIAHEVLIPEKQRLRNIRIPLAWSLDSGAQGPIIQGLYHAGRPFQERHHLSPLHLVRVKDATDKTPPNFDDYFKELVFSIDEGSGIAIFPEGDTMSGKRNENGRINGMHDFQENAIRSLILAVKKAGKKSMIIPVGLEGGFRIQNPETKHPTRWAMRLGLNLSDRELTKLKVGLPMPTDQGELGELVKSRDWVAVNELVARKIATLVPPNHRGIYRGKIIFPGES